MFPRRLAVRFLLSVGVLYALLTAGWGVIGPAYGSYFRTMGGWVFGSFPGGGVVRFQSDPRAAQEKDSILVLSRRGANKGSAVHMSSRYVGYAPTTLVIALILGTPIPGVRRLYALFWGLLLVNAFVLVRVLIGILIIFGTRESVRLYTLTPFTETLLAYGNEVLCLSVTAMYVVPILIWIPVSFRRDALTRMVQGTAPGSA